MEAVSQLHSLNSTTHVTPRYIKIKIIMFTHWGWEPDPIVCNYDMPKIFQSWVLTYRRMLPTSLYVIFLPYPKFTVQDWFSQWLTFGNLRCALVLTFWLTITLHSVESKTNKWQTYFYVFVYFYFVSSTTTTATTPHHPQLIPTPTPIILIITSKKALE